MRNYSLKMDKNNLFEKDNRIMVFKQLNFANLFAYCLPVGTITF